MERHLEELVKLIPDLLSREILDLGAGRGRFMSEVLRKGGRIVGLEPHQKYIDEALNNGQKSGLDLDIRKGTGEKLPFGDSSFGFVNMNEVIEHVLDPEKVMREVYRILKPTGSIYISVPNRFGFKDQHFHLYFVNWMPRAWSDRFISLFGKHKDYGGENGLQRLSEMHYFTFGNAKKFFERLGFGLEDIREKKISKMSGVKKYAIRLIYKFLRPWYFDSFHVLLTRS